MTQVDIATNADLDRIKKIVLDALSGYRVTVYLFGSRARGDARSTSDVDLAVEPRGELPQWVLAELRDTLEESTIPFRVEIVDLREADRTLRESVHREGVVWQHSTND